jgi:hypothetical protein
MNLEEYMTVCATALTADEDGNDKLKATVTLLADTLNAHHIPRYLGNVAMYALLEGSRDEAEKIIQAARAKAGENVPN